MQRYVFYANIFDAIHNIIWSAVKRRIWQRRTNEHTKRQNVFKDGLNGNSHRLLSMVQKQKEKKYIIYIIRLNSFRQHMKNKSRILNIFKLRL